MRVLLAVLIGFSIFESSNLNAELKITSPTEVCNYLTDSGLITGSWKNRYDNEYGCLSPYKELTGSPVANNIAFYADGDNNSVKKIKLVLNINDKASATNAHKELLQVSANLIAKTAGGKLPPALKIAIERGQNYSTKIGAVSVDIVREDWLNGNGYEVRVSIQ